MKYYSVLAYAKKMGFTTQTVYNKIKSDKIKYIGVEIGGGNKKSYVIVTDE